MSRFVVPTVESMKNMLEMLFGEGLKVSAALEKAVTDGHVATYVGDDDALVAVCSCDGQFVGYSGAALTMLPPGVVKDMLIGQDFSETVLGNFYEVMNICSRLLMSDRSPHLRLDKTLRRHQSTALMSGLTDTGSVAAFEVEIPRYGSGTMVFHLV